MHKQLFFCHFVAEFKFDGFSVDMTRSMVAMRDVSLLFYLFTFLLALFALFILLCILGILSAPGLSLTSSFRVEYLVE